MFGYIEVLLNITTVKNDDNNRVVLIMATFFHDAIYDVNSASNEKDSSNLFRQFWEELSSVLSPPNGPWEGIERISRYILATQSHVPPKFSLSNDPKRTNDHHYLCIFLDIDMAVLGKEATAYDAYAVLIREEYSHVPHRTYCEKRSEILESFLDDKGGDNSSGYMTIYATKIMREMLEERATMNLRREIKNLRNYTIV